MGLTREQRILKQSKPQTKTKASLASMGGADLVIPNHSGDHRAGTYNATPIKDADLVNKKYVDDQIATVDLSDYWKRDGTSTASGDWSLNTYDLTFTTGAIFIGDHGKIYQDGDDLKLSASEGAAEEVDIKGAWNRKGGLNVNDGILIVNNGSSSTTFRIRRAGVTFLSVTPYSGTGLNWGMRKESYAAGNNTVFTEHANAEKNHDHAAQTNPTVWGHSVTDPDTDNTQWWSLTHDQTNAVMGSGKGNISMVPAADFSVDTTTGGFIVPRMTTTQRNALTAVNGMIIYNSTTGAFNFYEGGAWVTGSGLT